MAKVAKKTARKAPAKRKAPTSKSPKRSLVDAAVTKAQLAVDQVQTRVDEQAKKVAAARAHAKTVKAKAAKSTKAVDKRSAKSAAGAVTRAAEKARALRVKLAEQKTRLAKEKTLAAARAVQESSKAKVALLDSCTARAAASVFSFAKRVFCSANLTRNAREKTL